ncbi:hypothetical protein [Streptomyces sp. NPDC093071]|uniref:hypothetical protein n=1 Tax=Streptomyces sp. NPDC093071 TaxID=3366022 RepID=UPI00382A4B3F
MPFDQTEVRWDLACGAGVDGRWHGWFDVRTHADALRRHGLHPEQSTARITAPSPPGWWHAAAERHARW